MIGWLIIKLFTGRTPVAMTSWFANDLPWHFSKTVQD